MKRYWSIYITLKQRVREKKRACWAASPFLQSNYACLIRVGLISVIQTKSAFWQPNHYSSFEWIIQWWFWNIYLTCKRISIINSLVFVCVDIRIFHAISFFQTKKSDGWSIVLVTNKTPTFFLSMLFLFIQFENLNKIEIGRKFFSEFIFKPTRTVAFHWNFNGFCITAALVST